MQSSVEQPGHPEIGVGSLEGGVLITIHRLSQGGADRVAVHLANGFAERGYKVGMAMLRSGGEAEAELIAMLDPRVGLSHAGAPMGQRHLELMRGRAYLRALAGRARPSLVLASSNNMGLVTGLSRLRGAGAPGYAMKFTNPVIRPEDRTALKRLYRRRLYGLVFSRFDRVIALSDAERRQLQQAYPDQAAKFRTAANPYVFGAMVPRKARRGSAPRILSLARMMPQKRLDLLLEAFARLGLPDAELTILGDGPERPRLEALAARLGIAGRVAMPGFASNPADALGGADLLVLSSDYEGLPAVLFEALACNVPVVTTDSFAAARTLLDGVERCAVVRVGDADALAAAMRASLEQRDRKLNLAPLAAGYRFDAAIAAHLDALEGLLPPL